MQTVDDHLTFLLPRPIWVNDIDVSHCTCCSLAFGHLRRRHHCRHCGNIYCHDCSSRKVPIPQLGYGNKPVRVCNDCFEVAYLVTYAIDEDHGLTTQIHGARGLLELTEKGEEKDLHNMVAYGGIDALIWLCRTSTNTEIHHLLTTNLAMLAEKESIRPVIITKWALPPLLQLLRYYMHTQQKNVKKAPSASIDSSTQSSTLEDTTKHLSIDDIDYYTVHLEIIINCTHVIYQLARAGILSQEEIVTDGVLETLFSLALYQIDDLVAANDDETPPSEKQLQQLDLKQDGAQEQWKERESIIQGLAAKSISFIGATVSNQASMIEQLQNSNSLSLTLLSSNDEVKKYIAKTVAYLSLRNDKYKPILLAGGKVRSLLSVLVLLPQTDPNIDDSSDLRKSDIAYYLSDQEGSDAITSVSVGASDHAPYTAAVSHICCALANFATNHESQVILMTQPRLLHYICNVPSLFPTHLEIHRHVARCLANLALYNENNPKMLACSTKDSFNVIPTILAMGQSANATSDIRRHIIRALDNLCSNALEDKHDNIKVWKSTWREVRPLIEGIMGLTNEEDTLKRAKSILERCQRYNDDHDPENTNEPQHDPSTEPYENEVQHEDDTDTQEHGAQNGGSTDTQEHDIQHDDSTDTQEHDIQHDDSTDTQEHDIQHDDSTDTQEHDIQHDDSMDHQEHDTQHEDSTEADPHENGQPKAKSSKKNKKKKKHA